MDALRLKILRMIADHEDGGLKYVFNAQEISNRLGLTEHEAHKQLDILAHSGLVKPLKSQDAYGAQMTPAGWRALEEPQEIPQETPHRIQFINSCKLHPAIEEVSGHVYRDGHLREAALNAYIRVIEEVKKRSGLPLDGEPLMNRAFGCEKQTPVIQVNALSSDAEIDEQRGFLFLFKGVVGLRNLKAHSIALIDDPHRAHDYLALASLLMRILEISKVNSVAMQ